MRSGRRLRVLLVVALVGSGVSAGGAAAFEVAAAPDLQCVRLAQEIAPPVQPTVPAGAFGISSPFTSRALWVDPRSQAAVAAHQLPTSTDPSTARRIRQIAAVPTAGWLTSPDVQGSRAQAGRILQEAAGAGRTAVLVAYVIPLRDCAAGESAGGVRSGSAYQQWISGLIAVIAAIPQSRRSVAVILEPDALSALDDLPADRQAERLALLRWAADRLDRIAGVGVYLDAGHSDWVPSSVMADRLAQAGIGKARGFALNVSNFRSTADLLAYGQALSGQVGWKRFVVDTSRNGAGPAPDGAWCNPPGRALGAAPSTSAHGQLDALLWIKPPGESDGACAPGQPPAGQFSVALADDLARTAGW
ncbi:MAG: glycoside hydrolase family 6 protein [Nakamurella sp.]